MRVQDFRICIKLNYLTSGKVPAPASLQIPFWVVLHGNVDP